MHGTGPANLDDAAPPAGARAGADAALVPVGALAATDPETYSHGWNVSSTGLTRKFPAPGIG